MQNKCVCENAHSANLLLAASGQNVRELFHREHRKGVLVSRSCSKINKEHLTIDLHYHDLNEEKRAPKA